MFMTLIKRTLLLEVMAICLFGPLALKVAAQEGLMHCWKAASDIVIEGKAAGGKRKVGANLCVRPTARIDKHMKKGEHIGSPLREAQNHCHKPSLH